MLCAGQAEYNNKGLTVKPLRCINILWFGVNVRYTLWNMLDMPQQNPLKYGFSGIEESIEEI